MSRRYEVGYPPGATSASPLADLAPLDSGKAHGNALARLCAIDITVVHLHAAHPHVVTRRLEPQLVARADRARPERARHDRPEAGDGERAVDVEPRRPVGARVLDGVGDPPERGAELVETLARPRAHAHDLDAGDELARFLLGELDRVRVDGIDLRERDDAVLDPEEPQDREVLVRLRPRALAGVDDEEEEVDPGRSRDHRAHEALVAGTSITESRRPSGSSSGA